MKRVRYSIGSDEYKRLITYTMGDCSLKLHSRKKLLKIFGVLYYTGIRLNEIAYITVAKLREIIKNEGGIIYTSKKDKQRQLYFSEEACKSIKKLIKDDAGENYIATSWNKTTTPMHHISLIQMVNKYMLKVLGAGYTSHSFRQGIITEMFRAKVSTAEVQKFIGHSDPATTLRYAKPTDADVKNSLVR